VITCDQCQTSYCYICYQKLYGDNDTTNGNNNNNITNENDDIINNENNNEDNNEDNNNIVNRNNNEDNNEDTKLYIDNVDKEGTKLGVCMCKYNNVSIERLLAKYNIKKFEDLVIRHDNNCGHIGDCKYFDGICDVDGCECYMDYYIGSCPIHDKTLGECIFCTTNPYKRYYTDSELLHIALSIMKITKKDLIEMMGRGISPSSTPEGDIPL
jgi:hypothetical protein